MEHSFHGKTNRVMLEPLVKNDLETLRILRNKKAGFFLSSTLISQEQQLAWYERYLCKNTDIMFRISLVDKPAFFVGAVALYDIDQNKQQAEFGRLMIDKEKTSEKGLGYEATICACNIGFFNLNLKRIYLDVFEDNLPAINTYRKAGFSVYDSKRKNGKTVLYMEKYTDLCDQ